jgi:hypothetical protein
MRRVIFGIIWAIVIYFAGCIVVGAIAGAMTGAADPQTALETGRQAGSEAVERLQPVISLTAATIGAVGSWMGFLPGTRARKRNGKASAGQ